MKKVLGSLALFDILTTVRMVYAQQEIDACFNFNKAGDYKRAIEAGKLAVKKYPKNSDAYYCLGEAYLNIGELKLAYTSGEKLFKQPRLPEKTIPNSITLKISK
jgi:TolA-binding protein